MNAGNSMKLYNLSPKDNCTSWD
uniref:Uncharacterized protein n=1 Tax=Anguilla anguilla TaxID=7936 RepID=A0A0E9R9M8_ANGAN